MKFLLFLFAALLLSASPGEAKETSPEELFREAERLERQAEELAGLEQYRDAERFAADALELREKQLGPNHATVAELLILKGDLLLAQEKPAQAEPLYQRALRIRETLYGPLPQPETAEVLVLLAGAQAAQKQTRKAQDIYERVLAVRELAVGAGAPVIAKAMIGLAKIHLVEGQPKKAEPLVLRAIEVQRTHFGPQHPVLAGTLVVLAELYAAAGDYPKAKQLAEQALSIRRETYGPQHPLTAETLLLVVRMEAPSQGPDAPGTLQSTERQEVEKAAKSLAGRAEVYEQLGRPEQAEQLYRQALAVFDGQLESPAKAEVFGRYADFLKKQGRHGEAEQVRRRISGP